MEYVAYYWEYCLRELLKPRNDENEVNDFSGNKIWKEYKFHYSVEKIDGHHERNIVARQLISNQKSSICYQKPSLTLVNNLPDRCPQIPEQKHLGSQPPTFSSASRVSGLYESESNKRSLYSSGALETSKRKMNEEMNPTCNTFSQPNRPESFSATMSESSQRPYVNECVQQHIASRKTNVIKKDNVASNILPQLALAKKLPVAVKQEEYTNANEAFDAKKSLALQSGVDTESGKLSPKTSNTSTRKLNHDIQVSYTSESDQLTQVKSNSAFCSDQLKNLQSYGETSSGRVSILNNSTDSENKPSRELNGCLAEGKQIHCSNSSTPLRDIDFEERDFGRKQPPKICKNDFLSLRSEMSPNCSQAQSKIYIFPPQGKEAMIANGSSKMAQLANTNTAMKNINWNWLEVEEAIKNQPCTVPETNGVTKNALSSNLLRHAASHSEQYESSKAHDSSVTQHEKPPKNIAQTQTKQFPQQPRENVTSETNHKLVEIKQVIRESKLLPIVQMSESRTKNSDLKAFHAVESTTIQLSQLLPATNTLVNAVPDLSSSDEESMLPETFIYRPSLSVNTFSDLSSSETEPVYQNLTFSSYSSLQDTSTDSSSSDIEPEIQNMTISNNITAKPNSEEASVKVPIEKKSHGGASTPSTQLAATYGELPSCVSVEQNGLKETDTSTVVLSEFISIQFLDNIFSALQLVEFREEIVRCNPWITVKHLVKFRPVHLSYLLLKISKDDLSKLMTRGIFAYRVYFPPSSILRLNDKYGKHVCPVLEHRKWSVRGFLNVGKEENFTKYYMLSEPDHCDENDILNLGVPDITFTDNQGYDSTQSLLPCPKYCGIKSLGRCVHLDDAVNAAKTQTLTPQQIAWPQNPELANTQVLWTAPEMPECKHNFYGNVTFSVSWDAVLERFGPYMYIIGKVTNFRSNMRTRILMTRKSYKSFEKLDLTTHGSPMIKGENGRMLHAVCCQKGHLNTAGRCHTVQFALECEEGDSEWFYAHSNVMPNHHVPTTWNCFKFNVMENKVCPFRKTPGETRVYLETEVPQLFKNQCSDKCMCDEHLIYGVPMRRK